MHPRKSADRLFEGIDTGFKALEEQYTSQALLFLGVAVRKQQRLPVLRKS